MATWDDVTTAAPELATLTRELFEANTHLTIATLRKDGAPRISGIECRFIEGDLWFGSMPNAVKALRPPARSALRPALGDRRRLRVERRREGRRRASRRSPSPDRRKEIFAAMGQPDSGESHLFRAELNEVSTVRLGEPADHLVIDSWREGEEPKQIKR